MSGKGSKPRNIWSKQFRDNYDSIDFMRSMEPKKSISEWLEIYEKTYTDINIPEDVSDRLAYLTYTFLTEQEFNKKLKQS